MKFYLKRNAKGRVYISQIEPDFEVEEAIGEIDAENWIKARETTRTEGHEQFTHHYGHGYH